MRLTADGAVLQNGMTLVVPDELRMFLHQGHDIHVRGLAAPALRKVQVFAVLAPQPQCAVRPHVERGPYPGSPQYDALLPMGHVGP